MNLEAYLQRIGYGDPVAPTLATLRNLVSRHTQAIPFENLNPLLGLPVSLKPADLERKIVEQGRGGYCFEHNLLLSEALSQIGFQPYGLAARVLWMREPDEITPRSHILLLVPLSNRTYLVDAGFGGLTLTDVLELVADTEQATPHESFRLLQGDDDWLLQVRMRDSWYSLYRFDLQRQYLVDYEICNYYLSTHPQSRFVTGLMAARATPLGRFALQNRNLVFHHRNGDSERRCLRDSAEIRTVLESDFRIRLPDVPQLDARLNTLP